MFAFPGRLICAVAAAALVLAVGGDAAAAQIEFDFDTTVTHGEGEPTLTVRALAPLTDITVELHRSDGHQQSEEFDALSRGQSETITIEQPPGRFDYDASIRATASNGEYFTVDFDFQVVVIAELDIELLRDQVDLDAGLVPIRINQAVERVEIEVRDTDGEITVEETQNFGGSSGRLNLRWQPAGDVNAVRLTIHYGGGAWYEYTLEPFWIEIPQQVINFETGSATISDGEASKLETTRDRIREALDDTGEREAQMRLYVAGYTDTVGPAAQNLALSQRRARALANWFRDHDIDIPIFYQGFGQEVLAVETPDETAEVRNRRAVYILGNTPPPTSGDLPRSDWQRLP